MRESIGGSFLFLRSREGGGAYESDLNMAGKQSTKSKNQSKPKEEIIMSKKRSIKVYGQSGYKYRETPAILLKGQWLKEAGFDEYSGVKSITCPAIGNHHSGQTEISIPEMEITNILS